MRRTRVYISDLKLRAIIGTNDWEREKKQEIVVNLHFDFDASQAVISDDLWDTVDYKSLKNRIIEFVENSQFQLLEKLSCEVLQLVMQDPLVLAAGVRIEKPNALRFARSVAVEMNINRAEEK